MNSPIPITHLSTSLWIAFLLQLIPRKRCVKYNYKKRRNKPMEKHTDHLSSPLIDPRKASIEEDLSLLAKYFVSSSSHWHEDSTWKPILDYISPS